MQNKKKQTSKNMMHEATREQAILRPCVVRVAAAALQLLATFYSLLSLFSSRKKHK
jgi:hypothetical protein